MSVSNFTKITAATKTGSRFYPVHVIAKAAQRMLIDATFLEIDEEAKQILRAAASKVTGV